MISILYIGLASIAVLLAPVEPVTSFDSASLLAGWQSVNDLLAHATLPIVMLCDTLVEPYYVAAGFALYLNRRSELEGWDLELALRRIARRLERSGHFASARALAVSCAVATVLGAAMLCSTQVTAADVSQVVTTDTPAAGLERAKQTVHTVLADPEFGGTEGRTIFRYHGGSSEPDASWGWLGDVIAAGLKWGVRAALVLLVIGIVVFVLRGARPVWPNAGAPAALAAPAPVPLPVAEFRPDDIADAARALLRRGDAVAALALLYRATLGAIERVAHVKFSKSDTEGDCMRRAKGHVDAHSASYLADLLDARRMATYAHRSPPIDQLEALCDRWVRQFNQQAIAEGGVRP